jgi:hypothetical protein
MTSGVGVGVIFGNSNELCSGIALKLECGVTVK